MKHETQGQTVARKYAELLSVELRGKVWATIEAGRIVIRGEGLPVHPQYPHPMPKGWSLMDRKTFSHAREYIANRGCMGQWVAYDPLHNGPGAGGAK